MNMNKQWLPRLPSYTVNSCMGLTLFAMMDSLDFKSLKSHKGLWSVLWCLWRKLEMNILSRYLSLILVKILRDDWRSSINIKLKRYLNKIEWCPHFLFDAKDFFNSFISKCIVFYHIKKLFQTFNKSIESCFISTYLIPSLKLIFRITIKFSPDFYPFEYLLILFILLAQN